MSTDEYVPSDEEMIHWFEGEENPELARDLWNTWLAAHDARVRRDAEAELDSGMTRAYEAEKRAWQAEAQIKAVRDVLEAAYDDQVSFYDIRRALEG